MTSPGALFRAAVANHAPLPVVGTINAYCAMLAERSGHKAIYLSGGGVANASYGLPDLGITTMNDVVADVSRITAACKLPLLVDIDTGFGSAFNVSRTITELERAGAAAVHMEDQVSAKRCGHRPGKQLVSADEMVDRIKAAVHGRRDPSFVIMARTDAFANEGMAGTIKRCKLYIDAGADMLFPEALTQLEQYKELSAALPGVPILANITEFGKTPLFTQKELGEAGASIVLYPLSAFRAMSRAALNVYDAIIKDGSQAAVVDTMQPRAELYDVLGYHKYEQELDQLFGKNAPQ